MKVGSFLTDAMPSEIVGRFSQNRYAHEISGTHVMKTIK